MMFLEICLILSFFIEINSSGFRPAREFEIQHRPFKIREIGRFAGKENPRRFTIEEQSSDRGKSFVFLEHGKSIYKFNRFDRKWNIEDVSTKKRIATIQHRPSLTDDSYKVKINSNESYRVSGNFKRRTFRIKRQGQPVATACRDDEAKDSDLYRVKIEANENSPLILMIVVAIDDLSN